MNEAKKTIVILLGSIAVSFFVTTNIFLPTLKKNKELISEYAKLKAEVGSMEGYSKNRLTSLEESLQKVVDEIEKNFLPEKNIQLSEQLAQAAPRSDMIFSDISYRKPVLSNDYQVFPVDISARASFQNIIAYLARLETGDLFIGIDQLSLRRISAGEPALEAKLTLFGFRLAPKSFSMSKYLEEQYVPFDEQRLQNLLKPVKEKKASNAVVALKNFDPFFSIYDYQKIQAMRAEAQKPLEKIETSKDGSIIDELTLKGIMFIGGKKVALLNDRIVQEGEQAFGVEVLAIEDQKVTVQYGGKKYILKIGVGDEIFQ